MSEKFQEMAAVLAQSCIAGSIYDLTLYAPRIARQARPGQFVNVYSADKSKLLPRPISICGFDAAAGTIRLVYRVTREGSGTDGFSRLREHDTLRLLGPLGNGYAPEAGKRALIIGGGIGVPPMLGLARSMKAADMEFVSVMGYRDAQTFLLDEFLQQGACFVATEDGSVGTKGNVLDAIRKERLTADVIYACGPLPMLRALKSYAAEQGMDCYLSLEERMACGIGACLACVCRTTEADAHSQVNNKRVCKEGPVFRAEEVQL